MKVPLVLSHGIGDMLLCSLGRERVGSEIAGVGFVAMPQKRTCLSPHRFFLGGARGFGKATFPQAQAIAA